MDTVCDSPEKRTLCTRSFQEDLLSGHYNQQLLLFNQKRLLVPATPANPLLGMKDSLVLPAVSLRLVMTVRAREERKEKKRKPSLHTGQLSASTYPYTGESLG